MSKHRLEAFSDGVFAIIITIMVLELHVPHGADWAALGSVSYVFFSYLMSFVYVGIYWNNHHHFFQLVEKISGGILWANLHLLFYISLVPFATQWMGENHFAKAPVAFYGCVLLMPAIAWQILQSLLIKCHGRESKFAQAVGTDRKGLLSPLLYVLGIASSFWNQWVAIGFYAFVALMWLIPDRRFEARFKTGE